MNPSHIENGGAIETAVYEAADEEGCAKEWSTASGKRFIRCACTAHITDGTQKRKRVVVLGEGKGERGAGEGAQAGEYVIRANLTNWPKKYESLLFVADNLPRQGDGAHAFYTQNRRDE